ncbi:MAG TPA: S53 family peptidase [Streptosporangiaceae bacterium]|nr:S53 family peptidase [Streptosporangiaceae bacterium]
MRPARIAAAVVGLAAMVALAAVATGVTAPPAASQAGHRAGHRAGPAIVIAPSVIHLTGAHQAPPSTAYCERHYKIACYEPAQIEQAYHLPALYRRGVTGAGQTIVIVDSYGSPTVARDLAVFDRTAGLAAPPSLRVIQPAGKVAPYRPTGNREGWAGETDLDVEYAHAIAPGASILLVETPTSENEGTTGFPQIVKAEKYVIAHHLGGVISQSFSATEETFASRSALLNLRGAYVEAARAGVTVLTASGDSGAADVRYNGSTYYLHAVTSWPDSDPLVTGVGGTQLHLAAAGPPRPATAWNDTYSVATNQYIVGNTGPNPLAGGGGRSVIFGRPAYQDGVVAVVGSRRGVPDISMSAACNGAADMYQSFPGQPAGWYPTCGTSEATPEFAGIVALADQVAGRPIGLINPYLYRLSALHAAGIADVVSGGNTVSFRQGGKFHTVRGFRAGPGYDLASGVGTVNGALFVPELAVLASHPGWSWPRIAAAAASALR